MAAAYEAASLQRVQDFRDQRVAKIMNDYTVPLQQIRGQINTLKAEYTRLVTERDALLAKINTAAEKIKTGVAGNVARAIAYDTDKVTVPRRRMEESQAAVAAFMPDTIVRFRMTNVSGFKEEFFKIRLSTLARIPALEAFYEFDCRENPGDPAHPEAARPPLPLKRVLYNADVELNLEQSSALIQLLFAWARKEPGYLSPLRRVGNALNLPAGIVRHMFDFYGIQEDLPPIVGRLVSSFKLPRDFSAGPYTVSRQGLVVAWQINAVVIYSLTGHELRRWTPTLARTMWKTRAGTSPSPTPHQIAVNFDGTLIYLSIGDQNHIDVYSWDGVWQNMIECIKADADRWDNSLLIDHICVTANNKILGLDISQGRDGTPGEWLCYNPDTLLWDRAANWTLCKAYNQAAASQRLLPLQNGNVAFFHQSYLGDTDYGNIHIRTWQGTPVCKIPVPVAETGCDKRYITLAENAEQQLLLFTLHHDEPNMPIMMHTITVDGQFLPKVSIQRPKLGPGQGGMYDVRNKYTCGTNICTHGNVVVLEEPRRPTTNLLHIID